MTEFYATYWVSEGNGAEVEHETDLNSKQEALEYAIVWLEKKRERDEFIESNDSKIAVKSKSVSSVTIEIDEE